MIFAVLYWGLPLLICFLFVDMKDVPLYIWVPFCNLPFFVASYLSGRTKKSVLRYTEYYYFCWYVQIAFISGLYSFLDINWKIVIGLSKASFILFFTIIPVFLLHLYMDYINSKKCIKKRSFGKIGKVNTIERTNIEKEGFRLLAYYRDRDQWVDHLIENNGRDIIKLFGHDYKASINSLKSMWEWDLYADPRSGICMSWKDWAKFFDCACAFDIYNKLNYFKEAYVASNINYDKQ